MTSENSCFFDQLGVYWCDKGSTWKITTWIHHTFQSMFICRPTMFIDYINLLFTVKSTNKVHTGTTTLEVLNIANIPSLLSTFLMNATKRGNSRRSVHR